MHYLHLVRYKNLLLLGFMQFLIHFFCIKTKLTFVGLDNVSFLILLLSTLLIAAAGYVVNDIFDQDTDQINKPNRRVVGKKITEDKAYQIYLVLNIVGVCMGFYVARSIGKPNFAVLFVLFAALLYFYSTTLKQIALVGNLVIAAIVACSSLIVAVFDLVPVLLHPENQAEIRTLFSVVLDISIFSFLINLMREIIKDIEDIEGDKVNKINTLAVSFGKLLCLRIVVFINCITILLVLIYCNNYFIKNDLWITTVYFFVFVVSPLLYLSLNFWKPTTTSDFSKMSAILKSILFFGLLSIVVLNIELKYVIR